MHEAMAKIRIFIWVQNCWLEYPDYRILEIDFKDEKWSQLPLERKKDMEKEIGDQSELKCLFMNDVLKKLKIFGLQCNVNVLASLLTSVTLVVSCHQ
jgi:hypothetical protein